MQKQYDAFIAFNYSWYFMVCKSDLVREKCTAAPAVVKILHSNTRKHNYLRRITLF
jgi:hypothetical protein